MAFAMTNRVFNGERPGRKWVSVLGWIVGGGLAGVGIWLTYLPDRNGIGPTALLELGGTLTLMVCSIIAKMPRHGHIECTPSGELLLSWRRKPVSVARTGVGLGRWVDRATGTPLGIYAEIDGIRIGGRGHEESGFQLNAEPEWGFDIELAAPAFADLVDALGTPAPAGPRPAFAADLLKSYRFRHMMIGLVIGLLPISVVYVFSGAIHDPAKTTPLDWPLFFLVIPALYWPKGFALVFGRQPGSRSLHVRPDELVLTKGENGPVVAAAPWPLVAVRCLVQLGETEFDSGEYSRYPILELTIGARKPVRLGPGHTVRSSGAWPHNAQVTRHSPDYLLGETHWRMLRRTLKDKGLLFGSAR